MRRIIVGVTVLLLVVSGLAFPPKGNSQEDDIGFVKVWETPSEEYISMDSAVAKDGKVYGINTDHYGTAKNNLMCIDNGKVIWSSEETFYGGYYNIMPTYLFENTVIACGMIWKEGEEKTYPLMVCYTLDGKKVWDKKLEQKEYVSVCVPHKGKIWLVSEKVVYVLDPKTGTELKKIDLSKDFPSPPPDDEEVSPEPSDQGRLRELYIRLDGDCAFLFDNRFLKNYQIKDDLSLEFKWEKTIPKDNKNNRIINSCMMGWFQANDESFISFESEEKMVSYDTKTGNAKWEMTQEYISYSYVNYNKNYLFVTDHQNTNCYSFTDQKLLWTKKGSFVPMYIGDKTVYLLSFSRDDSGLDLVWLRSGGSIAKVAEVGARFFVVDGDNVVFLKEHGISKYTMCNPCACSVNVSWKANGKDTMDLEVCQLQDSQLEIEITNPNDKALVDCVFGRTSEVLVLSDSLVTVGPGETKIVKANYTVGMTMPKQTEEKIQITTNCNQTFTLTLKIKKAVECKDKLKKIWTIDGDTFYAFGSVLVKTGLTSTGWFSSNLTSLTGYNANTGKALWTLPVKSIISADGEANIVDIVGNLFIIEFYGNSKDKWAAVDGVTGKIVWKRPAGTPAKYGESFKTTCDEGKSSTSTDLFDIKTGKTIVSKLKVDCGSNIKIVCKIGKNYLLYVYKDSRDDNDNTPNYWLVRTDGKVYWRKNLTPCMMDNVFEYDSLYVQRNLEPEKERDDYVKFKIAKLDPIKLKELWSTTVEGWPYIVLQDKNKVVFYSHGGIICLNPADGKKFWGYGDSTHGMSYPVIAKGLIISQTWNRDEKSPEKNKMYAIDPNTGKNTHEMEFEWYADYQWDDKYFYIIDENWSQKPRKNTVYCIDLDGWKTLWTATGYGELIVIGEKMIFVDEEKITWFEKGQQVGSFAIGLTKEDRYDFSASQYVWEDGIVYRKKDGILWVIDAKTSKLLLKLQNIGYADTADIVYEYTDYHYPERYRTPCFYGGKVFFSTDGRLEAYELIK